MQIQSIPGFTPDYALLYYIFAKIGIISFWGLADHEGDAIIDSDTPVMIEGLEGIVLVYADAKNFFKKPYGEYYTYSLL